MRRYRRALTGLGAGLLGLALLSLGAVAFAGAEQPVPQQANARAVYEAALKAFLDHRDLAKLGEALREAARLDPGFGEPRLRLAMLSESEHDWDQALRWLREVEGGSARPEVARAARGQIQRVESLQKKWATPEGRKRIRHDESLALALEYLKGGQPDLALSEAAAAIQVDPTRYEAYCALAEAHRQLGDSAQAKVALENALSRNPGADRPALERALADVERDRAHDELVKAAEADLNARAYDRAAQGFARARALRPDREDTALREALALVLADRPEEAAKLLAPLTVSIKAAVRREATEQLALIERVRSATGGLKKLEEATARAKGELGQAAKGGNEALGLYSEGIPEEALAALQRLIINGSSIEDVAFGPGGGWVILHDGYGLTRTKLPVDLERVLAERNAQKVLTRCVAFTAQGGWVVVPGDGSPGEALKKGLPAETEELLRRDQARGRAIEDLAFFPDGGWVILRSSAGSAGTGYAEDRVPAAMREKLGELAKKGESVTQVAVSDAGGWVLVRGANGWVSDGVPKGFDAALREVRDAQRTVRCLAFAPGGGWLIVASLGGKPTGALTPSEVEAAVEGRWAAVAHDGKRYESKAKAPQGIDTESATDAAASAEEKAFIAEKASIADVAGIAEEARIVEEARKAASFSAGCLHLHGGGVTADECEICQRCSRP